MPTERPITPQTLFAQGQFEDLLGRGLRGRKPVPSGDEWAYVAAALASTGRAPEAEALLSAGGAGMSSEAQGFAWYHVRPARLAARRQAAPFYARHALARALFAKGRLDQAARVAASARRYHETAFDAAYAAALDAELRVHLHGMRGELALSEAAFSAARWTAALALSRALYRARHGDGGAALQGLVPETPAQEASVLLERARLLLLAGKLDPAQRALVRAAAAIEPLAMPRFDRFFALRRFDLAVARGDLAEALIQLRVIESALDPRDEAILALECASRKIACLKALGRATELAEAARRFSDLRQRTGYRVPAHPVPRDRLAAAPGLNSRQLTFLSELAPGAFTDVHAYRARFDVAEITACRDLAAMVAQGALKRCGKARATRYVLPDP